MHSLIPALISGDVDSLHLLFSLYYFSKISGLLKMAPPAIPPVENPQANPEPQVHSPMTESERRFFDIFLKVYISGIVIVIVVVACIILFGTPAHDDY
ncbi:hypothetical protein CRE_13060 [Caenorhabditis remanei]|uniref:Uncharacterized protein n=1 Tax=Caenorhabditis remanei TaxID=31234 RepID=E3N7D9_CAERE|nr:hypothetical protein CRE_13060 [Caenorhabditis remanei]